VPSSFLFAGTQSSFTFRTAAVAFASNSSLRETEGIGVKRGTPAVGLTL
jgi:hypothetical protein